MDNQVSFWIGAFCAVLIIVPAAFFALSAFEDHALSIAIAAFGGVVGLVVVLVVVLLLRGWILKKIFGRTEVALSEVTSSLVGAISAAAEGDRVRSEVETKDFLGRVANWYSWSNFYRWVISTAVTLVIAFGAVVGTVLLFEQVRLLSEQTERFLKQTELMHSQTKLMDQQTAALRDQNAQVSLQNEIIALALVSQIREQLLSSATEVNYAERLVERGILEPDVSTQRNLLRLGC